ncbi:hypothetical protein M885DRAFT_619768 [Pelagophyceae sp. CCMP2097]|nr:hypothetical protein M885DRAFT_619768 [Pelagophyceae sp. CCMP2097]
MRARAHQYVLSLYFAIMTLTTVGYGDVSVSPVNISEYAGMIVCATAATLDIKAIEHQQLYDQVNNMLVDMVVRSFLFQSSGMERRRTYSSLVGALSPEPQGELCEENYDGKAQLGCVFHGSLHFVPSFRLAVFKMMTRQLYRPQELIHCRSLMIVANQGCVGCNGWLHTRGRALNANFLLQQPRGDAYMRCLNYVAPASAFRRRLHVEVECLTREDLAEVLLDHPADRAPLAWWTVFLALVYKASLAGLYDLEKSHDDAGYGVVRCRLRAQLLRGNVNAGQRSTRNAPAGQRNRDSASAAAADPAAELLAVVLGRVGAALQKCSADARDSFAVVEAAIAGNTSAFESPRLRADQHLVRLVLDRCGGGWRTAVLPHADADLRALLVRAAEPHRRL